MKEMTKKEMAEKINKLEDELWLAENKYFWGLGQEDIVMALYDDIEDLETYTEAEINDYDLIEKINNNMTAQNFYVYQWAEDIQETELDDETLVLIKTYQQRFLTD